MDSCEEEMAQKITPSCSDSGDLTSSWISPSTLSQDGIYQGIVTHPITPEYHKINSNGPDSFHLESSHIKDCESDMVQHGFSLGRRSMSVDHTNILSSGGLRGSWLTRSIEDEDSEDGMDLTDIYKSTGDIPGALLYRTENERRAMSQRIGSIGLAGQNLGLGHILGHAGDDSTLIPSRLQVLETCYVLDESSPVQTDIRCCPPNNASRFQQLVYEFELCNISSHSLKSEELSWCPVATVHHPVIRVYRSNSSLLLGKCRLKQENHDTIYKLRVRAVGRLMGKTGPTQMWIRRSLSGQELSHKLIGEWSSDVYLTWIGLDNQRRTQQLTSL